MSRARRSLSSTASSHFSEELMVVSAVPEKITGNAQNASTDLEDGEITDEANLEESKTVEDMVEGVIHLGSSSEQDSRLDREQLSDPSEREHKENTVPKPSTADVDILKLLKDLEKHSGIDFPSHQTSTSSHSDSNPTPDVPPADSPRPLSEEELELAKDVVLDLLGWGVQPEYLIECGISSHAIYRIFTDLHLRLPSNLVYLGSG